MLTGKYSLWILLGRAARQPGPPHEVKSNDKYHDFYLFLPIVPKRCSDVQRVAILNQLHQPAAVDIASCDESTPTRPTQSPEMGF